MIYAAVPSENMLLPGATALKQAPAGSTKGHTACNLAACGGSTSAAHTHTCQINTTVHQCTLADTRLMPSPTIQASIRLRRRWWHQRFLGHFGSGPAAAAYARSLVPTPWSAVLLLFMGSFVVGCVEQFAQSHALEADTARLERETQHRHAE